MAARPTGTAQISVRVTLFADLRRFLPRGEDGPQTYTLPAGATVADLLAAIGVPPDDEITPASTASWPSATPPCPTATTPSSSARWGEADTPRHPVTEPV